MATEILGRAVVMIGADIAELEKGLRQAEKNVKDTTGKITEYINKLGITMTAIGTAIVGTYALMIKSSVEYADQIYEVSQRTGVAVETLSELKYVADQTESSFEAVAMGLKYLNKNIYDAANGDAELSRKFKELGIELQNVNGQTLKADEVFLRLADRFSTMTNSSAKTNLAMAIFGRQGEALIPVLSLGSEKIKELSETAKRLGIVLTTENARAIDKFSDNLKTLKSSLGGLWLEITQLVMPTIDKYVNKLTEIIIKTREWAEAHPKVAKAITEGGIEVGGGALVGGGILLFLNNFIDKLRKGSPLLLAFGKDVAWLVGILAVIKGLEWLKIKLIDEPAAKIQKGIWGLGEVMGGPGGTTSMPEEARAKLTTAAYNPEDIIKKHSAALKDLNDEYLKGNITVQEYYQSVLKLHSDGMDIKQKELDVLRQSIELQDIATNQEYQKLFITQQGIQTAEEYYRIKAEMANQEQTDNINTLASMNNVLSTIQSWKASWADFYDFLDMGLKKFSSGFSTAISSIILGTKTAGQAFKDFGIQMITTIVEFVVEWGVQALIAATIGTWITAMVSAQANALAAAWMPAAIAASIATFGGAAAIGTASVAGAMGSGMALLAGVKAIQPAAIVPHAEGGIFTTPHIGLIAERGPEAIIPLNGKNSFGNIYINIESPNIASNMDIDDLAERLGENIERRLGRA